MSESTPAIQDFEGEVQLPGRGGVGLRGTPVTARGAPARETSDLQRGPLAHIDVTCLPAKPRNTPKCIAAGMRPKIHANRAACDDRRRAELAKRDGEV
jgi:hypothetical protein